MSSKQTVQVNPLPNQENGTQLPTSPSYSNPPYS